MNNDNDNNCLAAEHCLAGAEMSAGERFLAGTDASEAYIAGHIDAEPSGLHELYRRTHLRHLYPRMCSGHVQGRVLSMLSWMIRPRRVLELGTYTGYSALCIAEGMPREGVLETVEIDDEMAEELEETFANNPHECEIKLHIGDAEEIVPGLDGEWDLVFIDANKRKYCEYFDMVVDRVPAGGFILADNTLWGGKMLDGETGDAQSREIARFNEKVACDPRVSTVILPVRDGLTLMRRL